MNELYILEEEIKNALKLFEKLKTEKKAKILSKNGYGIKYETDEDLMNILKEIFEVEKFMDQQQVVNIIESIKYEVVL